MKCVLTENDISDALQPMRERDTGQREVRGGEELCVYKSHYKCKQLLLSSAFSSFELSLFEMGRSHTVLCAVVYRPPKYNKDFLNDFSDFLAEIMPKYDRVLIVGDFNIHVCLP